jgi:hypothetical protein
MLEVLIAVTIKSIILSDVMLCSMIEFNCVCCLHLAGYLLSLLLNIKKFP